MGGRIQGRQEKMRIAEGATVATSSIEGRARMAMNKAPRSSSPLAARPLEEAAADHPEVRRAQQAHRKEARIASHEHRWEERR